MTVTTAPAPTRANWASGITSETERQVLAWMLAQHAAKFLTAASDENVAAHTATITEAMHLGCGLMGCCTDAQDAYADLTGRLPELVTA